MTPKPCIDCGTPCATTRCTVCERTYQTNRNASPQRAKYAGDWPKLSRATIAAYRAAWGDVCPGYLVPAHVIDLSEWTTDHHLGPMCRSCNSRKGALSDRPKR